MKPLTDPILPTPHVRQHDPVPVATEQCQAFLGTTRKIHPDTVAQQLVDYERIRSTLRGRPDLRSTLLSTN
jgi:hypothetical protein